MVFSADALSTILALHLPEKRPKTIPDNECQQTGYAEDCRFGSDLEESAHGEVEM